MKIVGYARVSTTAQDLLRQKELIKSFCNSNNYNLSAIYITKYNTDNIDDHGKAKIYNEVIDKIILDKGKLTINFLNGNTVILLRKNNAFIWQ